VFDANLLAVGADISHDPVTNNDQFLINTSGQYFIHYVLNNSSVVSNLAMQAQVLINGDTTVSGSFAQQNTAGSTGQSASVQGSCLADLTGAQYLVLQASKGGATGIWLADKCHFNINRISGAKGDAGATGIAGVTGVYGVSGVTGLQGSTGFGVQGDTGVAGIQGTTGISGVTGLQGNTGLGVQGGTGIAGTQGQTGIAGSGVTGVAGVTGIYGLSGVTGLQGQTGVGAQGATGIAGVTGFYGTSGVTGVQGLTGILGTSGVTGLIGVTGLRGTTGIQGTTGAGTTGMQGVTGVGTSGTDIEYKSATWSIINPIAGSYLGPRMYQTAGLLRISSAVSAATNAIFNIYDRTNVGQTGTKLMTADMTATTTFTDRSTSFASTSIPADTWLNLSITSVSGSPGNLIVTVDTTTVG
jgi:hypothetical protein